MCGRKRHIFSTNKMARFRKKRLVFDVCSNFFFKKFEREKKTRTCSSSVTRLSIVPLFFENKVKVKKVVRFSGNFWFFDTSEKHILKKSL